MGNIDGYAVFVHATYKPHSLRGKAVLGVRCTSKPDMQAYWHDSNKRHGANAETDATVAIARCYRHMLPPSMDRTARGAKGRASRVSVLRGG